MSHSAGKIAHPPLVCNLDICLFAGFCKFFRFKLAFCENENILLHNQANVAQSVEQRIRNAQVIGSNPIIGSIFFSTTYDFSQNPEKRIFHQFCPTKNIISTSNAEIWVR